MSTVSIKNFVDALAKAPAFMPPELNVGALYIQEKICNRLKSGVAVKFSEIDFSAFDLEDFDILADIQFKTDRRNDKTTDVLRSLNGIEPAILLGTFI